MAKIQLHKSLRLSCPTGCDWFRQLSHNKLLALQPGEFIWFIDGDEIQCVRIDNVSRRLDLMSDPDRNGVQVFYSYHDGKMCCTRCPRLIEDAKETALYHIIDMDEAESYFMSKETLETGVELKLVVNGGGSG